LSIGGVLVSAVFILAIVWAGLPDLMLDLCERLR
jgi:hypothetical protein